MIGIWKLTKSSSSVSRKPIVTKDSVFEAALVQFKTELKVTQAGILKIIGGGSEETIAKYLKELKSELSERQIAIFSPDIPLGLVPVLESIYRSSLEVANTALDEERSAINKEVVIVRNDLKVAHADIQNKDSQYQELSSNIIEQAHKIEALEAVLEKTKDDLRNSGSETKILSETMDNLKEQHTISRIRAKAEANEQAMQIAKNTHELISKLEVSEASFKAKYDFEKHQVEFERERSNQETARLLREIDGTKEQNKLDKIAAKDTEKRFGNELDISHAREDVLSTKLGKLELTLKTKLDNLEEVESLLSDLKARLETAETAALNAEESLKVAINEREEALSQLDIFKIMNKNKPANK
jgi:chromosome segregation ATPase